MDTQLSDLELIIQGFGFFIAMWNGIVYSFNIVQAGLGMILLSAPLEMQKSITVPQSVIDGCKKRSISTSGNLFGLNSLDMSKDQDPPKRYPETFTPKGIWALAGTIMCAFLGLASVIYYVS
jgi:iron transport multicopper oxidase